MTAQPERSSITFTVNTASIDTGTPDRDTHLRSADFFAVDQHPAITFSSSRVARRSDDTFDVEGTLIIRDTSKAITLPVSYLGKAVDPWGNTRLGFETAIAINRKDFGLNWNAALETGGVMVSDKITLEFDVSAIKQG